MALKTFKRGDRFEIASLREGSTFIMRLRLCVCVDEKTFRHDLFWLDEDTGGLIKVPFFVPMLQIGSYTFDPHWDEKFNVTPITT